MQEILNIQKLLSAFTKTNKVFYMIINNKYNRNTDKVNNVLKLIIRKIKTFTYFKTYNKDKMILTTKNNLI